MKSYTHNSDKKSGDGLALTEWNDLSSAVAGNIGLTLALNPTDSVGIGTKNAKNKLDVEGAIAIGAGFSGTKTAPANGLIVEGAVGIGTSVPDAKLTISNIGANDGVKMLGFGEGGSSSFFVESGFQPAGGNNFISLKGQRSSTLVNKLMSWKLNGNVGIGTDNPSAKLEIEAGGAGTIGLLVNGRIQSKGSAGGLYVDSEKKRFVGANGSTIGFYNNNWGLTVDENFHVNIPKTLSIGEDMTIGGNVDIKGKITVQTAAGQTGLDLASADSYAEMRVIRNNISSNKRLYLNWGVTDGSIGLYSNTGVSGNLTVSGNVGIGNTNPEAKLHVSGNTTINGKLNITAKNGLDLATSDSIAEMRIIRNNISSNKRLYLNWGVTGGSIGLYSDTQIDGNLTVTQTVKASTFKIGNTEIGEHELAILKKLAAG